VPILLGGLMGVGLALLATAGLTALKPGLGSGLSTGLTFAAAALILWLFQSRCQKS
jgi:hypothetical protein